MVGDPQPVAQLLAADRVLLVDDDRTLVLRGNSVMWGDVVVLEAQGRVTAAHKVGLLLVVVTDTGNVVLRRTATGYETLHMADSSLPTLPRARTTLGSS